MIPQPTRDGRWLVVCAALTVAAAVGFGFDAGWHRLAVIVRHPKPSYLGLALAAQAVALTAYSVAYRGVVDASGSRLPTGDAVSLTTGGFGAYLPGGGFRFDLRFLRREGQRSETAKAIVVRLSLLEYAVLAPAAWVAAIVLLVSDHLVQKSMTVPWVIGVPVGALLAGWLVSRHVRHKRCWKRLVPYLAGIQFLVLMFGRVEDWPTVAGMACYWLADMFSFWAGLRAFGADPGVAALVVAFASGYALSRRTMPLAGAGLTEVLLVLALTWVGVPLVRAVPGVFAYRFLNIWVPTFADLIAVKVHPQTGSPTPAG